MIRTCWKFSSLPVTMVSVIYPIRVACIHEIDQSIARRKSALESFGISVLKVFLMTRPDQPRDKDQDRGKHHRRIEEDRGDLRQR